MILILSTLNDYPTELVQQELQAINVNFYRINDDDVIEIIKLQLTPKFDVQLICYDSFKNKKVINLNEVRSFWYRRGYFNFKIKPDIYLDKNLLDYKINFNSTIHQLFERYLSRINHINKYSDIFINKLIVLYEAEKCGLKTPSTQIVNKKNDIDNKSKKITKDFVYPFFKINGTPISTIIQEIPNNLNEFSDSLIQDKIEKKYEIRTFFIKNELFSMAIFSQENNKTKLDFRNYDYENPNRMVRYNLPKQLEFKIKKLMNKINLNSASIDILVDKNNNYYFLEANPVGQWHFVSENCYYKLENILANKLL